MRKIALVVLFIAASVAVFAKAGRKKKTSGNDIVSIQVHRTACFGRCPEYKIEINSNGNTTYRAIRFNEDSGTYRKSIGTTKAMTVLNEFKKYHVDTCSAMYENRIPDVPGIIYIIKYKNGKTQTIHNAHFGPQFLRDLAQLMDEAGKKTDNSWKKLSGNPEAKVK